jgi:hypothetical protein
VRAAGGERKPNDGYFDVGPSIVIGLTLDAAAVLLAYESKELLVGEAAAGSGTLKDVRRESDAHVEGVRRALTMYFWTGDHSARYESAISSGPFGSSGGRKHRSARRKNPQTSSRC